MLFKMTPMLAVAKYLEERGWGKKSVTGGDQPVVIFFAILNIDIHLEREIVKIKEYGGITKRYRVDITRLSYADPNLLDILDNLVPYDLNQSTN